MAPGFALAVICGWLGGTFLFAGIASLLGGDAKNGLPVILGRGFWYAIIGAWFGVVRARTKHSAEVAAKELVSTALKEKDEKSTSSLRAPNTQDGFSPVAAIHAHTDFADTDPTGNIQPVSPRSIADEEQVYAQIAKEIESGTVDQGLWTRLLAQTNGDEKRTKVLYIKQRAERLLGLKTTPEPDAVKVKSVVEVKPASTGMRAPSWELRIFGGVVGLGVMLAVVLPAVKNDATSKMAEPIDWNKGVITPPPSTQSDSAPAMSGAFGENDKIVSGPDWDKGTIAPPTPTNNQLRQPQARPSWNARASDIMERVKRGEIPTIEGSTSRTAPVYGDEWSLNDTQLLENSQTWWLNSTNNVGSIFIHLQNQSVKDLTGAALEYQGRPCNEGAAVNTFYLTFAMPIPPGGQAVVNLRTDFPIETKGTTCLVIKRAWK
jgi:hypothetical protein